MGNPGDVKPVGEGVSECGSPTGRDTAFTTCSVAACWFILLCGGDKSRQDDDIATAKKLARELGEQL
jgi:putative addiction module killer protein